MRVLVLGATGMLGHKLVQVLSQEGFEVIGTSRGIPNSKFLRPYIIIREIYAEDLDSIKEVFKYSSPEVVINAIGVVKQRFGQVPLDEAIYTNSVFPHKLKRICRSFGSYLIHVSTDCVFSGKMGSYTETEQTDSLDTYGKTKALGEIVDKGSLTIRTSFIGRELDSRNGLLEWILENKGKEVQGYTKSIWNGLPVSHLAKTIALIMRRGPHLEGLYNIGSLPISKYSLICSLNEVLGLGIKVIPVDRPISDLSLSCGKFRRETGYTPLSWGLLSELLKRDLYENYDDPGY